MWAVPEWPLASKGAIFLVFVSVLDWVSREGPKRFSGEETTACSRELSPALRRVSRLLLVSLTEGGVQHDVLFFLLREDDGIPAAGCVLRAAATGEEVEERALIFVAMGATCCGAAGGDA